MPLTKYKDTVKNVTEKVQAKVDGYITKKYGPAYLLIA
jgi:hypothetical protein